MRYFKYVVEVATRLLFFTAAFLGATSLTFSQGLGAQVPPGLVTNDQLKVVQMQADKLRLELQAREAELRAALARTKMAEDAALQSDDRVQQGARGRNAAVSAQLEALRIERDVAKDQRDSLKSTITELQGQLVSAQRDVPAVKIVDALRMERDELARQNKAHQERASVLVSELATKERALLTSNYDTGARAERDRLKQENENLLARIATLQNGISERDRDLDVVRRARQSGRIPSNITVGEGGCAALGGSWEARDGKKFCALERVEPARSTTLGADCLYSARPKSAYFETCRRSAKFVATPPMLSEWGLLPIFRNCYRVAAI